MHFSKVTVLTSLISTAVAHTRIWGIWVNDVYQGDGVDVYVRSPPTNDPVKDLTSSAMTCNVNNTAVPQTISVEAGDKITFEWFHNTRGDDIIASSHKGPILVYISPTATDGAPGAVWTKLFQAGYSNGLWAVDDLLIAEGKHNIIMPNIPAGAYLLRAEIIALHEADVAYTVNPVRGAQLYMNCVQIEVGATANQSLVLPGGSSFPGTYTSDTPGIVWNIYDPSVNQSAYPIPGVAVWSGAAGGSMTA